MLLASFMRTGSAAFESVLRIPSVQFGKFLLSHTPLEEGCNGVKHIRGHPARELPQRYGMVNNVLVETHTCCVPEILLFLSRAPSCEIVYRCKSCSVCSIVGFLALRIEFHEGGIDSLVRVLPLRTDVREALD